MAARPIRLLGFVGPFPPKDSNSIPKNHIAGLCLSPELEVDILNMYILGVVPLQGVTTRIYYMFRFRNFPAKNLYVPKKNASWEGAKPHKYISKRSSSLVGLLRWRQCMALLLKRGGQYLRWSVLLAYHLKAPSKATNPEEWTCLTQEMEVLVQMMFPYELGDF